MDNLSSIAKAFSGADICHGPLAMIDPQVLRPEAVQAADVRILPSVGVPDEPWPLLVIIWFPQLACHFVQDHGRNPDGTRGLRKVMETL